MSPWGIAGGVGLEAPARSHLHECCCKLTLPGSADEHYFRFQDLSLHSRPLRYANGKS
jgi:hypothetical protein